MKLKRIFGFAAPVSGFLLMYLSLGHRLSVRDSDVRDLMLAGGLLLMITSGAVTSSHWAKLSRHDSSSLSTTYGGLWFRFVAGLMDFLFAGVTILATTRVVVDTIRLAGFAPNTSSRVIDLGTWYFIVLLFGYRLYFAGMESSPLEATIGKTFLRLRVTDLAGHRISFTRATLRYLGRIVSVGTFLLGFLIALGSRRKQSLHDLMAKTVVVDA